MPFIHDILELFFKIPLNSRFDRQHEIGFLFFVAVKKRIAEIGEQLGKKIDIEIVCTPSEDVIVVGLESIAPDQFISLIAKSDKPQDLRSKLSPGIVPPRLTKDLHTGDTKLHQRVGFFLRN